MPREINKSNILKTGLARFVLFLIVSAIATGCFNDVTGNSSVKGWGLNSSNTGLAGAGIDGATLPLYTGPSTVPAGTVISEKRIDKQLNLNAGNIIIERCLIQPATTGFGTAFIGCGNVNAVATIRDCDIDGSLITDNNVVGFSFAFSGSGVIERCNIHDTGSGIWLSNCNREVRAEGNYIHGLRWGVGGSPAGPSHTDGITIRGYSGPSAMIRNNRIDCSSGSDTGSIFFQPYSGFVNNVTVTGNLLEGLGYKLILETNAYGYGGNMVSYNNRFATTGWLVSITGGMGWAKWENNYINDPSRNDNKGTSVAKPIP